MQDHPVFYKFNSYIAMMNSVSPISVRMLKKVVVVGLYSYAYFVCSFTFFEGQRSFWELVEPLADGGRTGYRSSSAGMQ